jgi:erythromycin esterase-like protein
MWRNREFEAFLAWLTATTGNRPEAARAAFHGLDLYNLSGSMRRSWTTWTGSTPRPPRSPATLRLPHALEPASPPTTAAWPDPGYRPLRAGVVAMLKEMLVRQLDYAARRRRLPRRGQNAHLVQNAEAYYRAMYYGGAESWNLRDTHMFETLEATAAGFNGPDAKAVVWAHNSHIGDARATDMGISAASSTSASSAASGATGRLIGFGHAHRHRRLRHDWDDDMEVKRVLPSRSRQLRAPLPRRRRAASCSTCQAAATQRCASGCWSPAWSASSASSTARDRALEPLRRVHPARQFDAWVWFDETRALIESSGRDRSDHTSHRLMTSHQ